MIVIFVLQIFRDRAGSPSCQGCMYTTHTLTHSDIHAVVSGTYYHHREKTLFCFHIINFVGPHWTAAVVEQHQIDTRYNDMRERGTSRTAQQHRTAMLCAPLRFTARCCRVV